MVHYWGLLLGEGGKYVEHGYKGKYIAIGWQHLGDLTWLAEAQDSSEKLFEKLKKEYVNVYSNKAELSPVKIGLESGEVLRFVREIKIGDIVLVPNPHKREILIGRVTGSYTYTLDPKDGCEYPNRRTIEWIKTIPRDELPQKIKNSLVWLALRSLERHSLEIDAILSGSEVKHEKTSREITGEELYEQIIDKLGSMHPREFEKFIAQLWETMGFSAVNQNYVGDKGIDVIGTLNAGLSNIVLHIQVKKITGTISNDEVLKIRGTLGSDEHGTIVTTGRFTKQAQEEAELDGRKQITLIDGRSLVDLILEHYDELDDEYQDLLSLKKKDIPPVDRFIMSPKEALSSLPGREL